MFTGIVAGTYPIVHLKASNALLILAVKTPVEFAQNLQIGASIAVNGTCLTVTKQETVESETKIFFDIIKETTQKTNLAQLKEGDKVNLERALTLGSEMGGHMMTGHISTVAKIKQIEEFPGNYIVHFKLEKKWKDYLLPKTHIGIDGISLTLVDVYTKENGLFFTVHLIPETLRQTTLGLKSEGSEINIEFNQMIKAVVQTTRNFLQNKKVAS